MTNDSRRPHQAALLWTMLGCLLLAISTGPEVARAAAAPEASCAARLERVTTRGFATRLRCLGREKRSGSIDEACRSRAASVMTRTVRRSRCAADMSPALDTIDHCTAAVLAHIPDDGPCGARKVRAVRQAVIRDAAGRPAAERRTALCRAFDDAGSCAGDCLAVDAALADFWTAASAAGTLPPAAPDDQVILFGTYEGDAMSSTSLAGQDEETVTARVVIDPGATPLYVVLASYEVMIWRFEGAVSRVRQVVLLGSGARGVTGIAAEQVAEPTGESGELAGYFYEAESAEAAALRSAVEEALGRPVDVMAGSYSVGTVSLPSATVEGSSLQSSVPPGFDPGVYSLALWFSPGGVVDIDPSLVVSAAPAERYEILPQQFGLAQLVATGALEARGSDWLLERFYIARAIPRFPAGLYGAHSVTFILGTGVPFPAGSPGHSCVIAEETGLPVMEDFTCAFLFPG